MTPSSEGDHPYVAHYDWPAEDADAEEVRRDAEALARAERASERQSDFARWRLLRYAVAVPLALLSLAGGATAVIAALTAFSATGDDAVDLVVGLDSSGAVTRTVTVTQLWMLVAVLVLLEVVLIAAAALLFARGLHPLAWTSVTALAALATGVLAWGMMSGDWGLSSTEWPYLVAFPTIVVAGVLELWRARRLRARWGDGDG
jgi:hypothetical protein